MTSLPHEAASSVTELALLTLPSGGPLTPTILSALARAKAAMERVSGLPFAYVHCTPANPQDVLIIGGWPSVRFHMEEWIPSAENQALVAEFGELGVQVRWMWHLGVERGVVERLLSEGRGSSGSRLRIWRGGVARGMVEGVERVLGMREGDETGMKGMGVVGGLRLDDGFMAEGEREKSLRNEAEGVEEFVVFARVDEGSGVQGEAEKVLGEAQGLVERWEASNGVVLDV